MKGRNMYNDRGLWRSEAGFGEGTDAHEARQSGVNLTRGCVASFVIGMPDCVLGSAVCGYAIRDTVRNSELDPVQGTHVVTQENAVAVVD